MPTLERASLWAMTALLTACQGDAAPAFAVDSFWLEPSADGVHGFQTWSFYTARWEKTRSERAFVCNLTIELDGTAIEPGDGCPSCTESWAMTGADSTTDCDESLSSDPAYASLTTLAIGPLGGELTADDPHPDQSTGGYAAYGGAPLAAHGWAYPDALDADGSASSPDWDGVQPFKFLPAWFWDLESQP